MMNKPISTDIEDKIIKKLNLIKQYSILIVSDFVSIVTPNHTHYPIAKAFLESGFNVICDNFAKVVG